MKLEVLPGTTLIVSPGVVNHQGSTNNSPAPGLAQRWWLFCWHWDRCLPAHGRRPILCFPLGVMGRGAEWIAVLGTGPGGLAEMECPWPALCEQSETVRR